MKKLRSRRDVLRYAGLAAGTAFTGPLLLTACGDDDDNDNGSSPTTGGSSQPTTGGSASPEAGTPRKGGTLQIGQLVDVVNFDHQLSQAAPPHQLAALYTESLLRFRSQGDPLDDTLEGHLAKSWEQPDDTTFVIQLHENVTWHDIAPVSGRAFVAEDVVKTFERILNPQTASPLIKIVGEFIDSLEAPDEQTVRIHFKRPFVAFPFQLASYFLWMMPRETTDGTIDPKEVMIGTGPFLAGNKERGVRYQFTRNESYWGEGQPYLDGVDISIITDPARFFTALSTGNLHIGDVESRNLETFKRSRSKSRIESFPNSGRRELNLVPRPGNGQMTDDRVRQAILKAIDQDDIIKKAYNGDAKFSGIISPSAPRWALDEAENRKLFGRDMAAAKALLAEAGFEDGLEVQLNYTLQHGQAMADIAELLSAHLGEAGIDLKIRQLERTEFTSKLYAWEHEGIAFTPSQANFGGDPHDWLYKGYSVNGLYNFCQGPAQNGWADAELQKLVTDQASEFDEEARVEMARQAQRRLAELAVSIPTGAWNVHHTSDEKLKGYSGHNSALGGANMKFASQIWLES